MIIHICSLFVLCCTFLFLKLHSFQMTSQKFPTKKSHRKTSNFPMVFLFSYHFFFYENEHFPMVFHHFPMLFHNIFPWEIAMNPIPWPGAAPRGAAPRGRPRLRGAAQRRRGRGLGRRRGGRCATGARGGGENLGKLGENAGKMG